jgi:catechol 2,3-dioxygenase-like lactoylglutathione lyase family enzyme
MKRATLFAIALLLAPAAWAAEARVAAVEAVGMTVSDLQRSVAFYTDVLGFEPASDVEVTGEAYDRFFAVFPARLHVVRLRLGAEQIELTEFVTPRGRPAPADAQSNDRWFQHIAIVVSDMDTAYQRLRGHRVVQVSPEPQRLPDWNSQAGGIRAFYFRDPDGHPLELIWFPPGKGDPRWHEPADRLFLGIDHTAIATADTEASLGFYRDRLGMRVVGESRNSAHGPGIELLEYLAPGSGRPYPPDVRPNDLVYWQTRLAAANDTTLDELGRPIGIPDARLGFERAVALRDPDGHYLEVVTP